MEPFPPGSYDLLADSAVDACRGSAHAQQSKFRNRCPSRVARQRAHLERRNVRYCLGRHARWLGQCRHVAARRALQEQRLDSDQSAGGASRLEHFCGWRGRRHTSQLADLVIQHSLLLPAALSKTTTSQQRASGASQAPADRWDKTGRARPGGDASAPFSFSPHPTCSPLLPHGVLSKTKCCRKHKKQKTRIFGGMPSASRPRGGKSIGITDQPQYPRL